MLSASRKTVVNTTQNINLYYHIIVIPQQQYEFLKLKKSVCDKGKFYLKILFLN